MSPEEYLNRLIERHEDGELFIPATNDDVATGMAAAEALAQLNEIRIPNNFANSLEFSIRARARSLTKHKLSSIPLTQTRNLTKRNRPGIPQAQSRRTVDPPRIFKSRALVALLRVAAVLVIVGVGVLTASARALPGDALYSLKQAEKQFTLTFAGAPQNRATLQIDHLRSALVDLNTVVNERRDDDSIRLALDKVSAKTSDSLVAVAALPVNSERDAAQKDLNKTLVGEVQTLRQLLNNVDWPIRLAFIQQLGVLGASVPTVSNVVVHPQSNGTLLITLTGSRFASQAQLMIDGQQSGIVSQITSTQLIALLSNTSLSPGAYAIGIRNPDGTAAQLIIHAGDENNSDRQDSNHSMRGTPVPNPTGGSDD